MPVGNAPDAGAAWTLLDRAGERWAVRDLRATDAAALAAYFAGLGAADYAKFHPRRLDAATAAEIAGDAASPDALRCLLFGGAARGGPVAGYGFLWDWRESVPLLGMSLAPGARGRGLGAAFTRHLVARAGAAGRSAVRLTVYRDNVAAFRAYRAAGFEEEGSAAETWGGRIREEVAMRCPLPPRDAGGPPRRSGRREPPAPDDRPPGRG